MLTIIGLIVLGLIIFVGAGIFGWILELLGYVFEFLWEGFIKSLGCLFWVFIIFCILVVLCC
jgi:hypothetical protein